ncbi:MAG: Gfo/Idh/MocA family oxidoreductase [Bacteroidia bacterium]|nr:Gfo/Idh/MocA family oxidoreductase [Bacteroidia bacterium]NNF83392.1 Gfo/Idh/MocA family oxidoreductase [Flavobacteriaceae bacterium]NNK71472.1 Gfo/Idh/MocA family oxidoreductase [Flavobacteriaceae bacterium]NNL80214.1 Gfo/Idh/MocA family oxidoreductase [Flavobacteriaceae bacterium]
MNRKDFLRLGPQAALFLGLAPTMISCKPQEEPDILDQVNAMLAARSVKGDMASFSTSAIETVRIGMIGMGNRGSVLIQMFNYLISNKHAHIVAMCDMVDEKLQRNNEYLKTIQPEGAELYSGDDQAWKKLAERDDIDLLIIATPWKWHAEMSIYGMEQGKHVACEVPIAYTLDDCWSIIETAERTRKHCLMMENCCFNGEELWILNMIEQGVFGDVNHAEGAYIHDLRKHMLHDTYYEGQWRIKHHQSRNGNFYTTHGLGPVSFYMDIGRGDNYDYLVSMSSREQSLSEAAEKEGSPFSGFECGDMNTTLIRTKLGRTIMLQFDVHTGRPYSRLNTVTGTKAVHQGYPSKLYVGKDELQWGHRWLDEPSYKEYRERYDHPLWKKLREQIDENAVGHGGMDFVMIYRLIRCLNQGMPLDINVYDGVMWSAVTPLSELSVANSSLSVKIPDFTAGVWETKEMCPVLRDIL